jgi:hypothetical protein
MGQQQGQAWARGGCCKRLVICSTLHRQGGGGRGWLTQLLLV